MKRRSACVALAVALGAAVVATFPIAPVAQEIPTAKVAILDVQRILRESSATVSIKDQIKRQSQIYQDEIAKQEKELRAAAEELAGQRAILSAEAFARKQGEFKSRGAAVENGVRTRMRELDQARNTAIKEVERTLDRVVSEIAEQRGLNLILSRVRARSVVLYAHTDLNITDEVLRRLNERLPSVKVPLAQN